MKTSARTSVAIAFHLVFVSIVLSQDNPRHILPAAGIDTVKTLEQNWTDKAANWFYGAPQGSRLVPYDWFVHLEQAGSTEKFLAAPNIRKLGYIPRQATTNNPDGLPIGFTKDAAYEDGTPGLGVTCAACHTGKIIHNRVAYIVDGAPSLGDFESFLKGLAAALEATAADDGKFSRFANAVLFSNADEDMRRDLRTILKSVAARRREYNERNLSADDAHRFGYGRVDAFGAIFNEVSETFLGQSGNAQPANAPVSYPCLWDAPRHDRVQWNGAAENRTSEPGRILFGTTEVGALGRNTGEVLGVFGNARINDHELLLPRPYASTANKPNLLEIEQSLKELWSPRWPTEFGPIDETRRDRGAGIYSGNCQKCHELIQRDAEDRKIIAQLWNENTDPMMIQNFGRTARTGKLEGRRMTILGHERFQTEAPVGMILKHVVERAMLNSLNIDTLRQAMASVDIADEDLLNPGFKNTAIVTVAGREMRIPMESLDSLKATIRSRLDDDGLESVNPPNLDLIEEQLRGLLAGEETGEESAPGAPAAAGFGYKARPLNGIWATAPYLHNGSVPTLAELLKSPSDRIKQFHVGSQVFDPVNIGFVDDPVFPVFDTSVEGNRNTGHDHGGSLTEEQKLDLLEFLKSL